LETSERANIGSVSRKIADRRGFFGRFITGKNARQANQILGVKRFRLTDRIDVGVADSVVYGGQASGKAIARQTYLNRRRFFCK
jgi:hypothetical protein